MYRKYVLSVVKQSLLIKWTLPTHLINDLGIRPWGDDSPAESKVGSGLHNTVLPVKTRGHPFGLNTDI
jgi:hypothetical protein